MHFNLSTNSCKTNFAFDSVFVKLLFHFSLQIYPEKGALLPGSSADMVLLDKDLSIDTVMAQGKLMMKNGKLLAKSTFEEIPIA